MTDATLNPGARMYEEFLAVHAILRRGTDLVADAFARLAAGEKVAVPALVETVRWLIDFTHHHHRCEDDLFWPVLRGLFPDSGVDWEGLEAEHVDLDRALGDLEEANGLLERSAAIGDRGEALTAGTAATAGAVAAEGIRTVLASHLDSEEPVVQDLFPGVPGAEIDRLRAAILQGGPRYGTHLVFGLLADPEPTRGGEMLVANFPPALRERYEELVGQYRQNKADLGLVAA